MDCIKPRKPEEMGLKEVIYRKEGRVATIMINRPQNYNAYSTPALTELISTLNDAAMDDSIGVIILTGAGDRAFCTGGDVKEYQSTYTRKPRDYWKYMGFFKGYIEAILNCGKPVIARINGIAVGGGNESQLACDLSVMAQHGYLAQVGTRVGSVACGGATQWLSIIVGDKRAREMLMLNEQIPARKALEWGLVNRVVSSVKKNGKFIENADETEIRMAQKAQEGYSIDLALLDEETSKICGRILDSFPECTRYTKQQVNFWKDLAWHQTVGHARDWLSLHYCSLEPWEGMRAFVEKRGADYSGIRKKGAEGGSSEFLWGPYSMDCPLCGAKGIPEGFSFCGACGKPIGGKP